VIQTRHELVKPGWGPADIPDLSGRTAVVTGASGGIGYEIARQLAVHGAQVVLACRDQARAARAASLIAADAPHGVLETGELDLASLESVRQFAGRVGERHERLDILVNNAGIAGGPRRETADGFEAHFGVNHLGHFALTGLLLPALTRAGGRVVTMSSGLAAQARIDFDDLQSARRYRMTSAYGQSKLAGLLFALELDRRARSSARLAQAGVSSLATHPGAARTSLVSGKKAAWGRGPGGAEILVRTAQLLFAQPASLAALPALYQATHPAARADQYVGTKRHLSGYPAVTAFPPAALREDTAARLWLISQELTGVSYDLASSTAGT
jgi:NAD(P)-dependent dehydrogenase (short-subunit alcohol dehydrogenase family)